MSDKIIFRHKENYCPRCKKILNASASISNDEAKPKPGDITICFGCAEILYFKKNMKLGKATVDVLEELDNDELISIERLRSEIIKSKKED